uniref:PCI domain-containing protein n=1 Tax=Macrostomum lignano TaxID=282301 RepID=A0A1I8HDC9_9PLAT
LAACKTGAKRLSRQIFDVDPASQSILGKRRRSDTPPPPNPTSESNKTRVVAVAHAGGLNLRVPLALLPIGNSRHSKHQRRSLRRRDLGVQTEETQQQQPQPQQPQQQPASRPTAAVPPVPAAAATEAAQLQQLSALTDRAQASRAAALERQWRSAPLETLLRRAKSHKQQLEAAIKSAQPDSAKRHFLHAGLLFLAGCWADDERRRASAAAGDSALAAAAAPTRQTYREIATFVRQFARQLMRQSSNGGGNGRKPTAKDSLAELSMLMLLSVVEYRQYYCYRQELANHSAAMKNGNLAAEQREQFLGHLLHLYHATETWAHMMRNRDKLLAESPDLVRLEEEAVRLSGFRPAGPSDRLSHLLAYLQAAADVLGSSSAAAERVLATHGQVDAVLGKPGPHLVAALDCRRSHSGVVEFFAVGAAPDSQLVDVDPLLLSCRLSARHRRDFDSGSSQSTSTRVRLTGSTVYSQPVNWRPSAQDTR